MYVCTYVIMHVWNYVCMSARTYVVVYVCNYECNYVCNYVCKVNMGFMYVMYACNCACMYAIFDVM